MSGDMVKNKTYKREFGGALFLLLCWPVFQGNVEMATVLAWPVIMFNAGVYGMDWWNKQWGGGNGLPFRAG